MQQTLIVWDYFGVIAQDSFWDTARQSARRLGLEDEVIELAQESDLGRMHWDEYCQEVAGLLSMDAQLVKEQYAQHQINTDLIAYIKALPASYRHVVLSNAHHEYLLPIMNQLGLNALFADVFVSSQLGASKPSPDAYLAVLRSTGYKPTDAWMIDDIARNADAAKEVGMNAIHYQGLQSLTF